MTTTKSAKHDDQTKTIQQTNHSTVEWLYIFLLIH